MASRSFTKSHPSSSSSITTTKTKKNTSNFTSMVKKVVESNFSLSSKSKSTKPIDMKLFVPKDIIAEDLKKNRGIVGMQKKLFKGLKGKKEGEVSSERKALMEVKSANGNSRTLAMVLRNERELLSLNRDQEMQIVELKLLLEQKNKEVEKLKDLCLKQREEIKSLKSAILFPDEMNLNLPGIFEKQGSDLKQAKQLIPNLQKQVTSLTGQLQSLAEDLAEVKADKYSVKGSYENYLSSPRTPTYNHEEENNSLELSSGSPDNMFLQDLNPCLTPYYTETKSKEFESPEKKYLPRYGLQMDREVGFSGYGKKVSKSSDTRERSGEEYSSGRATRRSDESKFSYGKSTHHKLFQRDLA